ncbi:MAG: hypothetical protein GC178_12260 [Flavobacteriales bacterium]|nr:hypothetical protein [Flavobacteriales bacterium]
MNSYLIRFFFFLFSVLLVSCGKYPTFTGDYTRIEVGRGPEDIALDTMGGNERLIISCSERRSEDYSKNGFYDYNISSGKLVKLPMEGLPESIAFRPHGIDIGVVNGEKLIYSVNHEKNEADFPPTGRQSILVFELLDDKVVFKQQLTSELIISPNDVCTDHQGGIYVSNDSGKRNGIWEKLFELKRSFVIHYDGNSWSAVGDKLKYANGVGVKDGRLYITGTQEKNIISYAINADGSYSDKKEIPCLKGNDNITFHGNEIVTTAHLDFLKFMKHVKHADKPSPCAVYTVNLETEAIDTLYVDAGTILSAASTGLIYNGNLYISQVFNPYILQVPLNK